MPELKNRTKEEQEIAAILLLIFASEDMSFWLGGYREPQWFEARLQESPLTSRFRSMSRRAQDQMLREMRREVLRTPINERMGQRSEFYKYEIAGRMAKRHAEWLEGFEAEQRSREQDRRSGKKVKEPEDPTVEEIYPPAWAEREAASTVTDWVSETEIVTGGVIEDTHKIALQAYWQVEPGACPICEPLGGQPREVWSKTFPRGPKAHPNCLPGDALVSPIGSITAGTKARYDGIVIEISLASGRKFRVTENHVIPTSRGLLAAKEIAKGNHCFSDSRFADSVVADGPNDRQRHRAEDLYASIKKTIGMTTSLVPSSAEQFNGDGRRFDSDVEIVFPERQLRLNTKTAHNKAVRDGLFSFASRLLSNLSGRGAFNKFLVGAFFAPASVVSSRHLFGSLLIAHVCPNNQSRLVGSPNLGTMQIQQSHNRVARNTQRATDRLRSLATLVPRNESIGHVWREGCRLLWTPGYPAFRNDAPENRHTDAELLTAFLKRNTGHIKSDRVVDVSQNHYSGDVYDFQSGTIPYFYASGVIVHNCRCWLEWSEVLNP